MTWINNAKRVRFAPQRDELSQNTSKPNSRESLMLAQQHFPPSPSTMFNTNHQFGTFKGRQGLQTEYFVEFPDKDIIDEEEEDEVIEEEAEDEVSYYEGSENIEFEDQIQGVQDLVEEVWGKNNQDMNY